MELDKTIEEVKKRQKRMEKLAKIAKTVNIVKSGLSADVAGILSSLLSFIKTKSKGLQYAKEFATKTAGMIATPPDPISMTIKMIIDTGIKWYAWRKKEKLKAKLKKQMKMQKIWLRRIDGKMKEWAKKHFYIVRAEKVKFGQMIKVDSPIPSRVKQYYRKVGYRREGGIGVYHMYQLDRQLYHFWKKGDVEKYRQRKKELQRKFMIQHFLDVIRANLRAGTRPEYIFYTMFIEKKRRLYAHGTYIGKHYPPIAIPEKKRALWVKQAKIPYFNEIPKVIYQSKEFKDLVIAMSKSLGIKPKPEPEPKPKIEEAKRVDIKREIKETEKGLEMQKKIEIKEKFWEYPIWLLNSILISGA